MPYKGVIFDKDGTLIKIDAFWSAVYTEALHHLKETFGFHIELGRALKRIGVIEQKVLPESCAAIGSVKEVFQTALDGDVSIETQKKVYHVFEKMVNEAVVACLEKVSWLDEGALVGILQLRAKGVKLALITTDSERNTHAMLNYLGMENCFDFIGCGDMEDVSPKPDKTLGEMFMSAYALEPHQVLMVGDSIYDQNFAEALGIEFAKIHSPQKLREVFRFLIYGQDL